MTCTELEAAVKTTKTTENTVKTTKTAVKCNCTIETAVKIVLKTTLNTVQIQTTYTAVLKLQSNFSPEP